MLTRSVAAGFGRRRHGMPPPGSNDRGTALGQDGSDWSRDLATLTFDLLALRLVYQSHLRWGTFLPNLGLWVLELFAMYATDRRRDKSNAYSPFPTGGGIIIDTAYDLFSWSVTTSLSCTCLPHMTASELWTSWQHKVIVAQWVICWLLSVPYFPLSSLDDSNTIKYHRRYYDWQA